MTTSRSPKPNPGPSLPMIAATTAALPAVVLSSLAIAQPAAAESRPRAIPATLAAAMQAQAQGQTAKSLASAVIPAASVPAAVPSAFRPAQAAAPAEYTIARGDTISAIAGRSAWTPYAVLKLNRLQANTIIYPGQKIKLSGPAPAAPRPGGPGRSGAASCCRRQRLHREVRRHPGRASPPATASSSPQVFSWNGLNMGSIIYPGQKIKIGGGAAARPRPRPPRPAPAPAPPAPTPAPLGFLHHQVRRHPLRHRRQARRQALRHPRRPTG